MPQLATRLESTNEKSVVCDMISNGISTTSENLSESFIRSIKKFFSRSEAIQHHSPALVGDTTGILRKPLRETLSKIHSLLSWGENRNSYRTLAPDPIAIAHAESWIVSLFQTVEDLGQIWIKPSVTASPEGEVLFEWWHGVKKLTIYVGNQNIDYVQVWGTDIHAKITDGEIESISDCRSLWMWLIS
jgi:hypothetical protein